MDDHEERADKLEDDLAELEHEGERVEEEIDETRGDWEAKKPEVPGAVSDEEDDAE